MKQVAKCDMAKNLLLPASRCCLCGKAYEVTSGARLVAQKTMGIVVSATPRNGGDESFSRRSCRLANIPGTYLVVWGPTGVWGDDELEGAKQMVADGEVPWFCQTCAQRLCGQCGSPVKYPHGADILCDDGTTRHCAILPVPAGCTNPACHRYRE